MSIKYQYEDSGGNDMLIYEYSDGTGDLRLEVFSGGYESAGIELPKDFAERKKLASVILGERP
jgi:hypothetical protein